MSSTSWWTITALCLTTLSAAIALLKEKADENPQRERKRKWIRNVLLALALGGLILGIHQTYTTGADNKKSEEKHRQERVADKGQITGLQQSVETQIKNNDTQYSRHQQELHRVQDQLTALQKDVATEELRKRMAVLQQQLNKALAPAPKAKLNFSFWIAPAQPNTITDIRVPVEQNVATVYLVLANNSNTNAKGVVFWLRIEGKFHQEPPGSTHGEGAPDFEREFKIGDLPSDTSTPRMMLEIEVPATTDRILIGGKYRCENCEIERDYQKLSVTLGRTH